MKKSNFLLIIVFAALLAVTLFFLYPSGEREATYSLDNVNIKFDSAAIVKVKIDRSGGKSVTMENIDGKWKLTAPVNYAADAPSVDRVISGAAKFKISSLISSNVEKQKQFQVDSSGTQITVTEKSGKSTTLILGKMGPTFSETYVRLPDKNDVYLAEGFESYSINKEVKDWRDKFIFKVEKDSMMEIILAWNGQTDSKKKENYPEQFTLIKDSTRWRIVDDSLDNNKVNAFVNSLATLRTDNFVDTAVTLPDIKMSVHIKSKSLTGTDEATLFFYPSTMDSAKFWVKRDQEQQVFEISKYTAGNLMKRKADLLFTEKKEEKKEIKKKK